ncbi:uncharacterized protein LOC112600006, partial [Melanaphis sacchari]|uniref:uncharacterized protein LOC112600006 n=1 Tax=Melanaphis sacchari TaxID=742174 RepID=UPI000DC13BF3
DTSERLNLAKEKKPKVSTILDFSRRSTLISQKELNLIQNLVINAALPFNLVEHEDFKKLVTVGYNGCHVLRRKTLMKNITVQHENLILTMKDTFSKGLYYVIGLIQKLLKEYLVCWPLKGSHTYNILAKAIESVYSYFNIRDKVIYTTTDNGSNFVKSFQMFGQSSEVQAVYNNQKEKEILNTLEEINEEENVHGNYGESNIEEEEEEDFEFSSIPISEVLNNEEFSSNQQSNSNWEDTLLYNLPKHHRCASHTLNLIATADIENALRCNDDKNVTNRSLLGTYKKQSRLIFAKCQAIWNKQNRSSQMADIVKTNLDVYLKTPNDTRWNSWFDAIKFLIIHFKMSPSKFYKACDALTVNRFSKTDIEFLDEYLLIMEPLCVCLDVLQGEKHMYFGKKLIFCDFLVTVLKNSVEKHFNKQLSDPFLLSATLSHPYFKTAWLNNSNKKDTALSFL